MRDANTSLRIENLTLALPTSGDRRYAVEGLNLEVRSGEILCIVGESGSGKSLTVSSIMRLLPRAIQPVNGSILFEGRDLLRLPESEMRSLRGARIGMIFQEPMAALNPLARVGRQIEEVLLIHGERDAATRRARVLELVTAVGLPDPTSIVRSYPFGLSGGQRQRVMIAMALAMNPTLLLADEPTTALDVTTQIQILRLIKTQQRERGMGVVFITHDFGVVAEIADRVAVMKDGRLVEQGAASEVLYQPKHPYTRQLIDAVPKLRPGGRRSYGGEPILSVRGVSKQFRRSGGLFSRGAAFDSLKALNLDVAPGETVGIVGESGSGKSTLARSIVRLVEPSAGEILWEGRDVLALEGAALKRQRRDVQMIFQDPFSSLNPRKRVVDIVAHGPLAQGIPREEAEARAIRLLDRVGLGAKTADRFPHEFSGGQRQRIGIARALAVQPKLLIADEAVSALDVSVQAQVLRLLDEVKQDFGLTLLFITHDLRVAAQLSDRLVVMRKGEIVESGPPHRIFDAPEHPYTQALLAAIPGQAWERAISEPNGPLSACSRA